MIRGVGFVPVTSGSWFSLHSSAEVKDGSCVSRLGSGSGSGLHCAAGSGSGWGFRWSSGLADALVLVGGGLVTMAGLFRLFPLDASHSASFAFFSSSVSAVRRYWLRLLQTGGLLAFRSVAGIVGFDARVPHRFAGPAVAFPGLIAVGTVLVGGRAEVNPAGGRLAAGLDVGLVAPSDTDLDLWGAGL